MMIDVSKIQRNTSRYEFADGIRDFQTAFWLLITGFYAWVIWDLTSVWQPFVEFAREQGTVFVIITTLILPIAIPALLSHFGLQMVNEYVRRRWLWRNTGYIKASSWIISRTTLTIALGLSMMTFVAGILLAIQLKDASLIFRGMYIGMGFALAYMHLAVDLKLNVPRYRYIAIIGAAGTILFAVLPLPMGLFSLIVSGLWAVLLISGGIYAARRVAAQQKAFTDAA